MKQDPRYQEFAASYRDGKIFVKMPRSKARAIMLVWGVLQARHGSDGPGTLPTLVEVLQDEESAAAEFGLKSVFYSLTPEDCRLDIESLQRFEEKDETGVLRLFRGTLERGLDNDPRVDWITRTGGPKPKNSLGLEREDNPADQDLFDFDAFTL